MLPFVHTDPHHTFRQIQNHLDRLHSSKHNKSVSNPYASAEESAKFHRDDGVAEDRAHKKYGIEGSLTVQAPPLGTKDKDFTPSKKQMIATKQLNKSQVSKPKKLLDSSLDANSQAG